MKHAIQVAVVGILLMMASSFSIPQRPSILFIGDSNTEKGFLTGALQHYLDTTYGYTGSGYSAFSTNDLTVPYIGFKPFSFQTTYGSTFTACDMYNGTRAFTPPYPSPDGMWLYGSNPNDSVTVRFVGGSIDLYWLSKPAGGSFRAFIDGVEKAQVATSEATAQAHKTTIKGLDPDKSKPHRLKLSTVSGETTLLGFDVLPDSSGNNKRAVVHNWGNSWSSTVDFTKIDTTVFRTALQAVDPDVVIILLGQNDRGDNLDSLAFKNNMATLAQRVKNALPNVEVLLVSSHTRAEPYIGWSYPQAAAQTGAKFWDMFTFFLPYANNPTYTQDGGGHLNPAGGVICATELWKQLNKDFPTGIRLQDPIRGDGRIAAPKWKPGYYLPNGRKSSPMNHEGAGHFPVLRTN